MLQFRYTARELYDAAWHLRRLSYACRLLDRLLFIGIPFAAFAYLRPHILADTAAALAAAVGLLAWCVAAPWLHRAFSGACFFLAYLDQYCTIPRGGKMQFKHGPSGMSWRMTGLTIFTRWSAASRILVDPDYIFIEGDWWHWIPKRLFLTEANVLAFLNECETYRRMAVDASPDDWQTRPLAQEQRRLRLGVKRLGAEIERLGNIADEQSGEDSRISMPALPNYPRGLALAEERERLRLGMQGLDAELGRLRGLIEPRLNPHVKSAELR